MNENTSIATITKESIATLKNVSLRKSLKAMLDASNKGKKAVWSYAQSITDIIEEESFKDDFETQTNFAKYVDLSKATITNYVRSVQFVKRLCETNEFADEVEILCGDLMILTNALTVGKAYMLSKLTVKQFKDFCEVLRKSDVKIYDMSDRRVKELLTSFYSESKTEPETENVAEPETENVAEPETENVAEPETESNTPVVECMITSDCENIVIKFMVSGICKERMLHLDAEIIDLLKSAEG